MTRLVKLRRHWAEETRVLGSQVRWNSGSDWTWVEYEEPIFKLLQLESARCMATLIVKKLLEEVTATFQPLDASRTRLYRNVVMRAAHLSQV